MKESESQDQPEAKRLKVPESAVVDNSVKSTAEVAEAIAA
jgi:tRNA-dihydrouridine synthase 2